MEADAEPDGVAVSASDPDSDVVALADGSGRSAAVSFVPKIVCAWLSSLTALSYDTTRSKSTSRWSVASVDSTFQRQPTLRSVSYVSVASPEYAASRCSGSVICWMPGSRESSASWPTAPQGSGSVRYLPGWATAVVEPASPGFASSVVPLSVAPLVQPASSATRSAAVPGTYAFRCTVGLLDGVSGVRRLCSVSLDPLNDPGSASVPAG